MKASLLSRDEINTVWKRIGIFLGLTFALTYAYDFLVLVPLSRLTETSGAEVALFYQLAVAAQMFFPALCVLLTRLLTKEGFSEHYLKPNLKGHWATYAFAWFGPLVLTIFGAVLWFLLRPDTFDPNMRYILSLSGDQPLPMPLWALLIVQFAEVLIAPALNAVACFGEEWGWRGYLVPKLNKVMKPLPMLLLSGVIWGLWHAPIIALGHNYGVGYPGWPWGGIAMMCVFTVTTGTLLAYASLKTESAWPAIFGHGMINGCAGLGMLFTFDGGDPFLGPVSTGIVGMAGFIAAAVVLWAAWNKRLPKAQENDSAAEMQA